MQTSRESSLVWLATQFLGEDWDMQACLKWSDSHFKSSVIGDKMFQVRSMPGVVIVETMGKGHILLHAAPDETTKHIADLVSKQYDPFRKVGCGYNQHTGYVLRNMRDAPRSVIPPREEPLSVPPGVERDIIALLKNFPSGMLASRLLFEYRSFFGRELNMGIYLILSKVLIKSCSLQPTGGFSTVLQLLAQIPSSSIDMKQVLR